MIGKQGCPYYLSRFISCSPHSLYSSPFVIPLISQTYYCLRTFTVAVPSACNMLPLISSWIGPTSPPPLYYLLLLPSHDHHVLKVAPIHIHTLIPLGFFIICSTPFILCIVNLPQGLHRLASSPHSTSQVSYKGFGLHQSGKKNSLPPIEGTIFQFVQSHHVTWSPHHWNINSMTSNLSYLLTIPIALNRAVLPIIDAGKPLPNRHMNKKTELSYRISKKSRCSPHFSDLSSLPLLLCFFLFVF